MTFMECAENAHMQILTMVVLLAKKILLNYLEEQMSQKYIPNQSRRRERIKQLLKSRKIRKGKKELAEKIKKGVIMQCDKCHSYTIDFLLSSTIVGRRYNSKENSGKQINKIFNPTNKKPYTIRCSYCKSILKKVLE